jgi:small GTP-binding protein
VSAPHDTLNLGILAHVDAGKTSLTERLLFAAGVIDEIGRVDQGSTQTDTLTLERQRGITIKSAVVSFGIGDLTVNLIDTPGHPDFIAEVERVLSVLDGAVLVVSAVEGVQAQTRVLMRTLRRLDIPVLIFVNKIDRRGADDQRVLRDIRARLTRAIVPMGSVRGLGSRAASFAAYGPADAGFTTGLAETLADHDDALLAAWIENDAAVPYPRLRAGLVAQARQGLVHPVFFGSASTGAGVAELTGGLRDLLPRAAATAGGPAAGTVFKIERGAAGEKIAYVRMFSGALPAAFQKAVEETVRATLREGLSGWPVTDAVVTLTHSGYTPPPPFGWSKWSTSAADFRNLTPLVLMTALGRAGTQVYEPIHRFSLDIPADTFGLVLPVLARLGAVPGAPQPRGSSCLIEGDIPAARVHELEQQLPALTRGEAVLDGAFDRYQLVAGRIPVRPRSDHNPLNRKEYLLHVQRRVAGQRASGAG